jgi:hypothetical protein
MNKIIIITFLLLLKFTAYSQQINPKQERFELVKLLTKIADPVLDNFSKDKLKINMPLKTSETPYDYRSEVTHLEALGRTLVGMAPWLELGPSNTEEGKLREKYIKLSIQAIKNSVDPKSNDYLNFTKYNQPVVDAAFLAQALIKAPTQLWARLDKKTQRNLIIEFKKSRQISPFYNNWLLFSAMIEAAIMKYDDQADLMRIEFALNKHEEWYLGDGIYGDGPNFHWDYYNSFVIQPMILDILDVLKEKENDDLKDWWYKNKFLDRYNIFLERAQRYAEIQERLISPEGTFPPIGRSLGYRTGVFQHLAHMAEMEKLPEKLKPAQVREALFKLITNQMNAPNTFDKDGWLNIGFYGDQVSIGEPYISTGSSYLCTTAFLILGLKPENPFWTNPYQDWTQKAIWSGKSAIIDKAL